MCLKSDFNKKLMMLVLPIAFQQFMLATVSASDAIMLGMIDQNALSAVSLAGQIQFVFSLFLAAMTIGMSILVAQYWGKGEKETVEKIFAMVFKMTLLVSCVFVIGGTFFSKTLMRFFTSDEQLIVDGASYLVTVASSYLFCGMSQIILCILKNSGLATKSTVISSVTVLLNIFLNAVFIFGLLGMPAMGISGAAVATVISRLVELIWSFAVTLRKDHVRLRIAYLKQGEKHLKQAFWKYTMPVLGNEIVWGGGFTMYSVVMGHLGTDAVAANAIANIVKNLIACFCIGLGSGGSIMVGNELGAGHLERAKEYGTKLCRLAIMSGLVSGGLLLLISPLIVRFSSLTPQAKSYLMGMLAMCSYYLIGKSINGTTIGGIFCAGGDSKFGFVCDTITLWCVTVPLGFLAAFVFKWPVLVVYFIMSLDEIIKLPAVYKHYKKYRWVKDLTVRVEL